MNFETEANLSSSVPSVWSPKSREAGDRRSGKFSLKYLFTGKRKQTRRCKEAKNYYVDQFQASELNLLISLVFLTALDAIFTYVHLENGAQEVNPFLNYFYESFGFYSLVLVKMAITMPAVLFLTVHIKFERVKPGLYLLLAVYGILNIYHLWGFALY